MRHYPPPLPKPYNFVRLEQPYRAKLGNNHYWRHDHFESGKQIYTGRLNCQIEALSHIHIGSGTFELLNGEVVKGFIRSNGKLIIPGSSLKGVIRSVAEAISQSCVCKAGKVGKNLLPNRSFDECKNKSETNSLDYILCIACSIFGGMGYQGRVHFEDATAIEIESGQYEIPSLFSPGRDRLLRKYKDEYGSCKGRKFYYHGKMARGREPHEVIQEGSMLEFSMGFENLNSKELQLVLTSMGILGQNPLILKIGGGKPACMGTTKIHPKLMSLRKLAQDAIIEYDKSCITYGSKEVKEKDADLSQFFDQISKSITIDDSLIRQSALKDLSLIWQFPSTKECPDRVY